MTKLCINHCYSSWVLPLFFNKRKEKLGVGDLYKPLPDHKAETLGDQLEKAWEKQLRIEAETKKPPSLFKAFAAVFWRDVVKSGVIFFLIETLLK